MQTYYESHKQRLYWRRTRVCGYEAESDWPHPTFISLFPSGTPANFSRPHTILVVPICTQARQVPTMQPRYELRSGRGEAEMGSTWHQLKPAQPRIRQPNQLPPNQQQIYLVEVKYCEDTKPENQLEVAKHRELCQLPYGHGARAAITLHTTLLGVVFFLHSVQGGPSLALISTRLTGLASSFISTFCPICIQAC